MTFLSILRIIVLGLSLFFSLVALGLSSHLLFESTNKIIDGLPLSDEGLGIATSVLTALTLPVMLTLGAFRKGAFTSMVVVELSWLGFLWILWLATGGLAIGVMNFNFPAGCDAIPLNFTPIAFWQGFCNETTALAGIAFVNGLILHVYTIVLLIFAIIGQTRGQKVWTASVSGTDFLARRGAAPSPGAKGLLESDPYSSQQPNQPYQYPPNAMQSQAVYQNVYSTPPPNQSNVIQHGNRAYPLV